jgi:hypothetical protein
VRLSIPTTVVCTAVLIAGCGEQAVERMAIPPSGDAYRALSEDERLGVAASCRDRAAAASGAAAARELRRIDPRVLRAELDRAFTPRRAHRRPVARMCAEVIPFVTPGMRFSFDRAQGGGDRFLYQTNSDQPLTIRGSVTPAPQDGMIVARRAYERAKPFRARIGADGRFELPTVRLRRIADNTFVLAVHAPPRAVRKVHFSAICLDCLAGGVPAAAQ